MIMKRKINKIVIHNSVTPRDFDFEKTLISFNNNHKKRLTKKYGQPLSSGKYKNIAYHFVISWNGEITQTRDLNLVWYHASNIAVNNESIWICLVWKFDEETPSLEQYKAIRQLLKDLKKQYNFTIHAHREFANKTCPWKNCDMQLIKSWDYEFLFKTGENKWKSEVLNDIESWIKNTWISRELAFSLLIMIWRIR